MTRPKKTRHYYLICDIKVLNDDEGAVAEEPRYWLWYIGDSRDTARNSIKRSLVLIKRMDDLTIEYASVRDNWGMGIGEPDGDAVWDDIMKEVDDREFACLTLPVSFDELEDYVTGTLKTHVSQISVTQFFHTRRHQNDPVIYWEVIEKYGNRRFETAWISLTTLRKELMGGSFHAIPEVAQ